MPQKFKQKSNAIVAFSFIGLIAISQIWIWSMGYVMPLYFFVILGSFCAIILWGMLDSGCTIDEDVLKSKVGPFVQKISIQEITNIKVIQKGKEGSRKRMDLVQIYSNEKKILNVSPAEVDSFLNALKSTNAKIKVEKIER